MQAVADSLYGNTYQMTGLNTAEKHLSPLIHQVWQIQMKKNTLLLSWTGIIYSLLYVVIKAFKHTCVRESNSANEETPAASFMVQLIVWLFHVSCDQPGQGGGLLHSSHKPYHQSHQVWERKTSTAPNF